MSKDSIIHIPALLRQAVRFVGLSGIGWLLDFTVFNILNIFLPEPALVNMISSLVGASFVFIFSTRFVFQDSHRIALKYKYLIYFFYQLVLILLISELLAWINALLISMLSIELLIGFTPMLSKIIVTPVTMAINFFAMKLVIERL